MARRNSGKQIDESTEGQPNDGSVALDETHAQRQPGDEPAAPAKKPFEPVRGWSQRFAGPLKYRKITDADMRVIAFKFFLKENEKPPEEVLTLMRSYQKDAEGNATGLTFQNSRKHGGIWTIPNDPEGRALADKIDFRLSELAENMGAAKDAAPAL